LLLVAVAFKHAIASFIPVIAYMTHLDKYVYNSLRFIVMATFMHSLMYFFATKSEGGDVNWDGANVTDDMVEYAVDKSLIAAWVVSWLVFNWREKHKWDLLIAQANSQAVWITMNNNKWIGVDGAVEPLGLEGPDCSVGCDEGAGHQE